MLSALSGLVQGFNIVVQFVTTFFTGIISVFGLVAQCWVFLVTVWGLLPSVVLVFAAAGLSICVVFQLIGR